jgi:hypothetical protein
MFFDFFWIIKTYYYINNRFLYYNIIKPLKSTNNLIKEFKHKSVLYTDTYIINILEI